MQFITLEGLSDYTETRAAMEAHVDAMVQQRAADETWLLEHPPLYTAGTSADANDLLSDRFPVYEAGRGGEYTYHGPGQRVAYVMANVRELHAGKPDLRHFVWQLEETIIRALAACHVQGERREGRVGIWVVDEATGSENKIAAIGIRLRKWISFHGIAVNVAPDLSHFTGIVPCGIRQHGVTSLHALGKAMSLTEWDTIWMEACTQVWA